MNMVCCVGAPCGVCGGVHAESLRMMNRRFVAQYYVVTYRTHPTVLAYIFRDGLVRRCAGSLGLRAPRARADLPPECF